MAVNLFTGALSNNWAVAGNWSQLSIPTASDGHVTTFNVTSPNCTLGANRVCNAIDFTGWAGTLTMGVSAITVSGDITFGVAGGMTISGTGGLNITATGNITSGGFVWPNTFGFQGTSQTYTLQTDLNIGGPLSLNGTTALTINNNGTAKVIFAGNNVSTSAAGVVGTVKITMNGTGNLVSTAGYIAVDMDINTAGTITIGTSLRFASKTLTYITGTVDTTTNSSTLILAQLGGTSTIINTSGITWFNVTCQTNATVTLTSDLYVSGVFNNSGVLIMNGGTIHILGSLTIGGSNNVSGTTNLKFDGASCSWTTGSGQVRLNTNVNTSGTFSLSGTCNLNSATFSYTAGNTNTTNGVLTCVAASTLDTGSMSFTNVTMTQGIQTLTSQLNVTDTLLLAQTTNVVFAGPSGFNVSNFVCTTNNRSVSFKAGMTYSVTNSVLTRGTGFPSLSTNSVTLQSDTVLSSAYFVVSQGSTCSCLFTRAIDLDSSAGRQMFATNGLTLRTTNWTYITPNKFFDFYGD